MHRPIAKLIALASFVAGMAACTSPTGPMASPLGASAREAQQGDVRHEPQPRDKHHEPEPGDNRGRGRGHDDGPGHR